MISDQDLRALLEVGSRAPSYHNVQPWRCRYGDDRIDVFLDGDRADHLLGKSLRPSLLALGGFAENVAVAAAARGWEVAIDLAEEASVDEPMVTIRVVGEREATDDDQEALLAALARETNRRAPEEEPIDPEHVRDVVAAAQTEPGFRLFVTDQPDQKDALAQLLSGGATLALYNPRLHDELLSYNRWTPEEAEQTKDGIDAATLEVGEVAIAGLKSIAPYEVFVAQTDPDAVFEGGLPPLRESSHIGVLVGPRDDSAETSLRAGRALTRLWNEAAARQLALQPHGVLLLYDLEDRDELEEVCDEGELEQTDDFLETLQRVVAATPDERAYFAFRLFVAERASARSQRRPVEDFASPK